MPNIDQLSIEIEANADKATKAIANLTSHLNGLSLALNRINTSSISKFAKSIEALSSVGKRTDDTTRALDNMAKKLAADFGVKSRAGLDAIRDGLNEVANASKAFNKGQTDALWADVEKSQSALKDLIVDYANLKTKAENTAQAVRDFVSAQNSTGRKISLAGVSSELGDDLAHVRSVLGSGFTSTLSSASKGVSDLEEFLVRLDNECGTKFSAQPLDEGIRAVANALEQAKTGGEKYEDSLLYQKELTESAANAAFDYTQKISKLVDLDLSNQTNNIESLVHSLRGLNDVKVPDFSSFANALNTLNKINIDRVVNNLDRVKTSLNESKQQAQDLGDKLGNISTSAEGLATGFTIPSAVIETINGINTVVNNVADSFRTVQYEIVVATQNMAVFNAVAQITGRVFLGLTDKVSEFMHSMGRMPLLEDFRSFNPDVVDVTDSFKVFEEVVDGTYKSLENVRQKGSELSFLKFDSAEKAIGAVTGALRFLGETVEKVGEKLGHLGDLGIKGLKVIYTPLKNLAEEYKEKAEKIADTFKKMRTAVEKQLTKMAAFWKRIVRTFTFMLVRKAITAMIKDIKEAIDELALFEKNLGTLSNGQFNKSLSEIQADFHYIGRAIVAAFEPLINYVVPALNAVASALANVLALVGEFFAAFTGQNYFVTARRTVVDYGDSIDDNNQKLKEQKKLLLGIDELNVMPSKNDSSGGSDGGVNYKDAFDEKPVSDKMKGIANKVKEILGALFDPLKEAWDRNGEYVGQAFKHMMTEISKLCASVGKDFLEVWNGPIMAKVFDHILQSIGDIMFGIGNLAKNFRDAWEDGSKGKNILENLAQIAETLTGWIEKVTKYFKDWTEGIDFNPLLSALEELTKKLNKVANFLGGVFYDVMTNVVFKYIEWMIEDGLPHLMHTLDEVITHFDFDKIRSDLQILEVAFEKMAEEIDKGVTNAIGNVGKALGDWLSSDEFTKFCNSLAYFMDLVTAERVEKLFTALGTGLLDTAKALADFVSSDGFKEFVDKIIEWYDSKSAEEIAKYLEDIAVAIAMFKFAEFAAPGVAGFINFITTIATVTTLGKIATDLSALAGGTTAVGTAAGAAGASTGGFAAALGTIAAPIAIVTGVIGSLLVSFGGLKGLIAELSKRFQEVKAHCEEVLNRGFIPMSNAVETVKTAFSNLIGSLGSFKGAWQWVFDIIQKVYDLLFVTFMGALPRLTTALGGLINFISGIINVVGGVFSTISGVIQGFIGIIQLVVGTITGNQAIIDNALKTIQKSFEALSQGVGSILTGISQAFEGAFQFVIGLVGGFVNGVIEFFKGLKYNLLGDPIVIDIANGVIQWFGNMFTGAIQWVSELVSGVVGFFSQLLTDAVAKAGEIKEQVVGKFEEFKTNAIGKFEEFKTDAVAKFEEAKTNAITKAGELKDTAVGKFEEFKTNAAEKFNSFKDNVKDSFGKAKENAEKKSGEILKSINDKFKDIPTKTKEKFGAIKGAIKEKMGNALEQVGSSLDKIKQKFEKIDLTRIAGNIIRGFTSGLKSAWQSVVQWANEAIASLKSKFQEGLQIHSPSKVFEQYGKYTVEGFNQGISSFQDTTSDTVDKWVNSFSDMQVSLEPDITSNMKDVAPVFDANMAVSNGTLTKDDLLSALNSFAAMLNNQNRETRVVLELDSERVYEKVVSQDKQQIMRTGKSSFAY